MFYSSSALFRFVGLAFLSDHKVSFKSKLNSEGRRRHDRRMPRGSLCNYKESPFMRLYASKIDQALINATGLDHETFGELLDLFEPVFWSHKPNMRTGMIEVKQNTGRPRDIDAVGGLGLVLMWYRTTGAISRTLSMIFGLTSTQVSTWLKFSMRVLLFVLQDVDGAKVCLPTPSELKIYSEAIGEKYPNLGDTVWAAMDGLKTTIGRSGKEFVQAAFYNGWTCGHYVNCIFVFAPDGRIRVCCINSPGAWHDSTQADHGLIHKKLEKIHKET